MIGGESPKLGQVMSRSFTWGIQTGAQSTNNAQASNAAGSAATGRSTYRMVNTIAKHLNAYAGPEGHGYTFSATTKRFDVDAVVTEREWRESYLPPFYGSVEARDSLQRW
jgi:beta-glucosidase-like glycosyl hydrolase